MAASRPAARTHAANLRKNRGFSLLEVLISIVILVVGLLGLAALQANAHVAELESYQRAQALVLLSDMVDRINANRRSAGCFAFTDATTGTPYAGTTAGGGHLGTANCGSGFETSEAKTIVDAAVSDWNSLLQGSAETKSGTSVGAMIGARGCVSFDSATSVYTIAVAWQGMTDTFAPVVTCARNLYGSEAKRRVVWTTLRVANLN